MTSVSPKETCAEGVALDDDAAAATTAMAPRPVCHLDAPPAPPPLAGEADCRRGGLSFFMSASLNLV